jgi:hypothetical protein
MKTFTLFVSLLFLSAGLFAHPDEPIPSDPSGYSWHTVIIVDYKPGTEESARQFIEKFKSASLAAGTAIPVIHWFENGKYDLVVTWNLDKSPSDDKWTWCPEGEDWLKALAAQEGSMEAARKVQEDYQALVASSVTNVARKAK